LNAKVVASLSANGHHACKGRQRYSRRVRGNRQAHHLVAQVCKLFLSLQRQDKLKAFELKALYKILFKYLNFSSITLL
jgi:hypothetical protein